MQISYLEATSAQDEDPPWVVLDGAHTPASAQALVSTLTEVSPGNPPFLSSRDTAIEW